MRNGKFTEKKSSPSYENRYSTVKGSTLLLIGISLIIGVLLTLLVQNLLGGERISFGTSELISAFFGIALSATSIVLSIAAISLGRVSEREITRRSDESISVQNEVFQKTVEVLSRIESSTGVTEKRIEDIIAGRAGDISSKIAASLLADRGLHPASKEQLEKEIRNSVLSELSRRDYDGSLKKADTEAEKERADDKRYSDYKDSILLAVSSIPDIKSVKIGDGSFEGKGRSLVDGLFVYNGNSFAISTLMENTDWLSDGEENNSLRTYIRSLAVEIAKKTFQKAYILFDRNQDGEPCFHNILDDLAMIASPEIVSKFMILSGRREFVIQKVKEDIGVA